MAHILGEAMTPAQQQRFIPPFVADPEATLAIGFTEEGAGSDHQGYHGSPDIDFRTTAVRDGESYILNGSKRYVSNGCMAKLYFIIARTDPARSLSEGGSVFAVPADTPGFRAGFFHEKGSQRLATNGTFHLENCRVPAENLLGGEGLMSRLRAEFMWGSKAEAAATALGVGRAAYEYAGEPVRILGSSNIGHGITRKHTESFRASHHEMVFIGKPDASRLPRARGVLAYSSVCFRVIPWPNLVVD